MKATEEQIETIADELRVRLEVELEIEIPLVLREEVETVVRGMLDDGLILVGRA